MSRPRSFVATALASVLAVACASTPKPQAQIVSSEAAIRGASEAGAHRVPAATLHLRLAEEQRQAALRAIADGDNDRGRLLLARSEADAELAIALARRAAGEAQVARATERVENLNRQVNP